VAESRIGDRGAELLLSSPYLTSLRELNLSFCSIYDDGVQALAASPHLSGLETLDLTRDHLGRPGVRALAESTTLTHLRELRLAHAGVPDAALADLADSPLMAGLEVLDLQGNRECGDAGLASLITSISSPTSTSTPRTWATSVSRRSPSPRIFRSCTRCRWDATT
jgi:hypothetical protein